MKESKPPKTKEIFDQIFHPFVDYPTIKETCTKCGHGELLKEKSCIVVRIPSEQIKHCRKCLFYKRLTQDGWVFG